VVEVGFVRNSPRLKHASKAMTYRSHPDAERINAGESGTPSGPVQIHAGQFRRLPPSLKP
jgi:hypothetical protein